MSNEEPGGDTLGEPLGRYRVERRLGQGGMGVVYAAVDLLLRRPVALKLLVPELARDPRAVSRFQREAQAAARVIHPNVVTVFDVGNEGGHCFLVMELVEGGS